MFQSNEEGDLKKLILIGTAVTLAVFWIYNSPSKKKTDLPFPLTQTSINAPSNPASDKTAAHNGAEPSVQLSNSPNDKYLNPEAGADPKALNRRDDEEARIRRIRNQGIVQD